MNLIDQERELVHCLAVETLNYLASFTPEKEHQTMGIINSIKRGIDDLLAWRNLNSDEDYVKRTYFIILEGCYWSLDVYFLSRWAEILPLTIHNLDDNHSGGTVIDPEME